MITILRQYNEESFKRAIKRVIHLDISPCASSCHPSFHPNCHVEKPKGLIEEIAREKDDTVKVWRSSLL